MAALRLHERLGVPAAAADVLLLGAGAALGGAAAALWHRAAGRSRGGTDAPAAAAAADAGTLELPAFAGALREEATRALGSSAPVRLQEVRMREWDDPAWRSGSGWKGRDLCHNPSGTGVRVLRYYWRPQARELVGVVWFGPDCESHRGLCHGGAMTSLMDDVCGHTAFVNGDAPWSGATVQVNVSLKKPVRVGQILRVTGKVESVQGKKVRVTAVLDDPDGATAAAGAARDPEVYALLEGLSISGVRLASAKHMEDDAIAHRVWADTLEPLAAPGPGVPMGTDVRRDLIVVEGTFGA